MTNQSKRKMNPAYFGIIWSRYQRNKSIDKTAQLENWSHETVRRVVASKGNYKKYQDIAHGIHIAEKSNKSKPNLAGREKEENKVMEYLEAKEEMKKLTISIWALRTTFEKFLSSSEMKDEELKTERKTLRIDDQNTVIS